MAADESSAKKHVINADLKKTFISNTLIFLFIDVFLLAYIA